jgi:hypothetical protein
VLVAAVRPVVYLTAVRTLATLVRKVMVVTLRTVIELATRVVIQVCAWCFVSVRPVGVELFLAGKMVEQRDEANSRF